MATIGSLYAWAVPALLDESPLDHTWVTCYDNRNTVYQDVSGVVAAGEDCWFCWGDFYPQGGTSRYTDGFFGSATGDLQLSRCLVASNVDCWSSFAARGTIFTYGVDGVCHQLANQVLYSTRGGRRPLTVAPAGGYWLSSAIYGTYGAPAGRLEKQDTSLLRNISFTPTQRTGKGRKQNERHFAGYAS